jgi:hypothetical protein
MKPNNDARSLIALAEYPAPTKLGRAVRMVIETERHLPNIEDNIEAKEAGDKIIRNSKKFFEELSQKIGNREALEQWNNEYERLTQLDNSLGHSRA